MLLWNEVTPVQQGGLGAFIRTRRKEIGMSSQDDLSEVADVGQKKISQMENDANFRSPIPPPDVVSAVARALRVTEADILRAAGYLTDEHATPTAIHESGEPYDSDRWIASIDTMVEAMTDEQLSKLVDGIAHVVVDELRGGRRKADEGTG